MTLAAGSRLGPYEVVAPLGAGGMGEVYRARDTRLGRDVAIKVLPASLATDAERLARFRREAQLLAALNHASIAAIYGLEESSGVEALVLELVEGETLAERLASGPLSPAEALDVARQIAAALQAAHERGIVHRDLKPANVKLTPGGQVKVLDFGLAKVLEVERPAPDLSHSPTITAGTAAGVILGTAAYMSPEQARGKPADKRADIWAYGAVLYEMLTGRRAFPGETVSDTLAAVLTKDPDWSALPASTPASVRRSLKHCLERDARNRFHDIADVLITMAETPGEVAPAPPAPRRIARVLPWLAAVLAAALAGAGWWRALRQPAGGTERLSRLAVAVSEPDRIPFDDLPVFDLSSDGRKLVYVSDRGDGRRLFLRSVDQMEPKAVAGSEGSLSPFFSPDSRWIGFFAEGKLKKVPSEGGVAVTLADAASPRGAVWLSDDTIVFAPDFTSGLRRVAARGGQAEVLTNPDTGKGERTHRWPSVLPGGALLFTIGTLENPDNFDDARLALFDPKTRAIRPLLEKASMGRYVKGGYLLCYRAGSLAAVGFDAERGELKGEPVRLTEPVGGDRSSGVAFFAVAADGTLAFLSASAGLGDRSLVLVDRNGAPTTLPLPARPYHTPRFSPDAKRVAVTIGDGRGHGDDIWMCDTATGALTRLTLGNLGAHAAWSPDGKRVALATSRDRQSVFARNTDGSGTEEQIGSGGRPDIPSDWSPDGRTLAVTRGFPSTDIWLLTVEGKRDERLFQRGAYGPVFSPDGRWIAYAAPAGGVDQVFVRPASGSGGALQVTSEGGRLSGLGRPRALLRARGKNPRPGNLDGALLPGGTRAGPLRSAVRGRDRTAAQLRRVAGWKAFRLRPERIGIRLERDSRRPRLGGGARAPRARLAAIAPPRRIGPARDSSSPHPEGLRPRCILSRLAFDNRGSSRPVRGPLSHRRGRHGRGLSGAGHPARAHGGDQGAAVAPHLLHGDPATVRARGQDDLAALPSAHLRALRRGQPGRRRVPGNGVSGRRNAGGPPGQGTAPARAAPALRHRDRRRAGQGAPPRNRAPGPEARQRDADEVGRQAARFRSGEGTPNRKSPGESLTSIPTAAREVNARRNDSRHAVRTWRPSSWRARRLIRGRTSSRLARRSTRWRLEGKPSRARVRRA